MHTLVLIGVLISLVFTEITGYSPGGIVVPGYLAMFAFEPKWLTGTVLAAIITYGLVYSIQSRSILYGRRLFAIFLVTGIVISQTILWLFTTKIAADAAIMVIGYLIPGLIARDFGRQGIAITLTALAVVAILTRLAFTAGDGLIW